MKGELVVCHIDTCSIFPPWGNNAFLMKALDGKMELNPCGKYRMPVVTSEGEKDCAVLVM